MYELKFVKQIYFLLSTSSNYHGHRQGVLQVLGYILVVTWVGWVDSAVEHIHMETVLYKCIIIKCIIITIILVCIHNILNDREPFLLIDISKKQANSFFARHD